MNENYGETFRLIRKSQGLTLKEVTEGIISLSCLGKFETGKSNIALPLLLKLLERLNLEVNEFLLLCDNTSYSLKSLYENVTESYHDRDLNRLFGLKKQEDSQFIMTRKKNHQLNSIMISAIIVEIKPNYFISKDSRNYLSNYLLDIPFWSAYNLFLLRYSHTIISPYLLATLMDEIFTTKEMSDIRQLNPRDLILLCHHVAITFLRNDNLDQATKAWSYASEFFQTSFFFEKNRHLFIEGLIFIQNGHIYEGVSKANDAISTLTLLGGKLVDGYVAELERTVNRASIVE